MQPEYEAAMEEEERLSKEHQKLDAKHKYAPELSACCVCVCVSYSYLCVSHLFAKGNRGRQFQTQQARDSHLRGPELESLCLSTSV